MEHRPYLRLITTLSSDNVSTPSRQPPNASGYCWALPQKLQVLMLTRPVAAKRVERLIDVLLALPPEDSSSNS